MATYGLPYKGKVREVTQGVLHQKFKYDSSAGLLIRRCNSGTAKAGDVAGTLHSTGYIEVRVFGKLFKAHRLIWMMWFGEWPNGEIDHINGVRNDNRLTNLRDVSTAENMRNKRLYSNGKTGVHGVGFYNGHWTAVIKEMPNTQRCIGTFDNLFDAVCARRSTELKLGYHQNHGRLS